MANLNICKYTPVRLCDEYGINARFNLLFQEVCTLKSTSAAYQLPIATSTILGGIKVGGGLAINPFTGVLSTTSFTDAFFHFAIKSLDFEVDGKTYLNPALESDNTSVFWNDVNRFIYLDQGEFEYVTGGIRILISGFDANTSTYNLEIFKK